MEKEINIMKKKIRKFYLLARYSIQTLTKPLDTVFELDYTNENRRQVNRIVYLANTLKWMSKAM